MYSGCFGFQEQEYEVGFLVLLLEENVWDTRKAEKHRYACFSCNGNFNEKYSQF